MEPHESVLLTVHEMLQDNYCLKQPPPFPKTSLPNIDVSALRSAPFLFPCKAKNAMAYGEAEP